MSLAGFDYRAPDITITTGSAGVAVLPFIAYDGSFRKASEKRHP